MKSRGPNWKSVTLTFVVALVFYFAAYSWLHRQQTGKGSWLVNFTTNSTGTPQLIIAQQSMRISNVTVAFPGEKLTGSNATGAVAFAKPRQPTPFGRVLYDDLMFQPGDVALDVFGHIIEMVPSVLGINGVGVGWTNGTIHTVFPTNKLSAEARRKFKGGYDH